MSESKGISLRKTKRSKKPAISAPKQISGPINTSGGSVPRSTGGKSSFDAPPPQRPQIGGKVCLKFLELYPTGFGLTDANIDF
jgi:exocyst complex component 8